MGKNEVTGMNKIKNKFSAELIITASFLISLIICLWVVIIHPKTTYILPSHLLRIYLIIIFLLYIIKTAKFSTINKLRTADVLLLIMGALGVISVIFAINKDMAIDGMYGRYEGIFSILTYYALFYTASNIKDEKEKKILLFVIISILVFSSIVGIITGLGGFDSVNRAWKNVASIPYGNPNFFGTIATLTVAAGIGIFIFFNDKKYTLLGIFTYISGVMAVYSCDSSGPIVGNIMVFLLVLVLQTVLCIKQKDKKAFLHFAGKFLLTIILYIGILFLMNYLRDGRIANEFNHNAENLKGGITADSFMTSRMKIWKAAFREFPNYWLHGVGVDNFYYVSEYAGINTSKIYYDKAHNEYLQIMLTEGLASAVIYISFLFVLFIKALKSFKENVASHAWLYLCCLTAFFAYISQAFFNIRIIHVTPFFWIICCLMYNNPCSMINIAKKKNTAASANETS